MKKLLIILYITFNLFACGNNQISINDYAQTQVKFDTAIFISSNREFSMMLPKDWWSNEDPIDSDTILYFMQSGSKEFADSNFVAFSIYKANLFNGSMNSEFDILIEKTLKKISNITLIEKSNIKIGNLEAKIAHFAYKFNGQITQEEIDFFIPYGQNQYYYIGMVSDKNEHIKNNFGMLLECVRTFKVIH